MTTEPSLKILALSGSLRAASFNSALLRAAIAAAPPGLSFEGFDMRKLPYYDADVDRTGATQEVMEWRALVGGVDGILIATPEYNHSIPAVLKNALDWASRHAKGIAFAELAGKPVGITGAGGSAGTARAQLHLRQILAETRSLVMVHPPLLVPLARQKFDESGTLTDEAIAKQVVEFMAAFDRWVRRIKNSA